MYNHILSDAYCYKRITNELEKHSPSGVEFVNSVEDADFLILHVNGRFDKFTRMSNLGKPFAIFQACLRSTQKSSTHMWKDLWNRAEVVWSYYDLPYEIELDGGDWSIKNFYHSPLGADTDVFSFGNSDNKYDIMVSGDVHSIKSECIGDVVNTEKRIFHLGKDLHLGENVTSATGISDKELASIYRSCTFVSGLRRKEGFEIPAAEGLLCGAKPILFNTKNFKQWYGPWAEFIPEDKNVVSSLKKLFEKDVRPITKAERQCAAELFNWKNIIENFWRRV